VEQYKQEDPKLIFIRNILRPLHPEAVDKIVLLEDQKSYTINKKKVYLCLRDENGEYYNDNMLIFVAIHELAHVLCDEIGHTKKFEDIFHKLLQEAIEKKLYDPSFEPIRNYCEY
jgi:AMMECR1 domain-containing protein